MEDFEVDQMLQRHCSRKVSRPAFPTSPKTNNAIVKSCMNCSHTFRSEFKPHTEFCSKDCETCFWWFKKKPVPTETFETSMHSTISQQPAPTLEISVDEKYSIQKQLSVESSFTQSSDASGYDESSEEYSNRIRSESDTDWERNSNSSSGRGMFTIFKNPFRHLFQNQRL